MRDKNDYMVDVNGARITVLRRITFFWFFDMWAEVTEADTELDEGRVILFNSVDEAINFIENICTVQK